MKIIANTTNQIGEIIKSQSMARRLMLLVIVLGSVAGMVYLTMRAQTGGYTVLFTGMQPQDAGEAVAKLRQMGIDPVLENGGTTIKVPKTKADDAAVMLAMEGIPSSGVVGFELMDKSSLGQSKFQQEKNYLRMREGELARTLLSIKEVERARVHLALPENSLFTKDNQKPTASIVLKLHTGANLDDRQVNGIVHLISHSVEGLAPEDVSIIDHMGNLLNLDRMPEGASITIAQQGFKTQFEDLMKIRIESMLEKVVGKGRVAARVQADFDFATMKEVKEIVNPDDQDPIKQSEKTQTEAKGAPPGALAGMTGVPGSTNNIPPTSGSGATGTTDQAGASTSTNMQSTTEYALSRSKKETTQSMPTPQRVSVAVLVDGNYEINKDDKGAEKQEYKTRLPEEMAQLENLVKATVGFTNNDKRQDEVKVECAQFMIDTSDELEKPTIPNDLRKMIEIGIQWGVVGLVSLVLIFMVLRPAMKQILVSQNYVEMPAGLNPALAEQYQLAANGGAMTDGTTGGRTQNPAVGAALAAAQASGQLPPGMSLAQLEQQLTMEMGDGSQGANKTLAMQHAAAQQAKLSSAQAQKVQSEVIDTAKNDPQKTVSLIRQWMDEA